MLPRRYHGPRGHGPPGPNAFSILGAYGKYVHLKNRIQDIFSLNYMHYIRNVQVLTWGVFLPCAYIVLRLCGMGSLILVLINSINREIPCTCIVAYGQKTDIRRSIYIYRYIYISISTCIFNIMIAPVL